MLPTIVREPLRSTYSSPGIHLLPFCCAPVPLPEPRARLLPRAEPLDSSTATRVSPASTETIIRFFKWVSPHRRGVDRLGAPSGAHSQGGSPVPGGEPRLDVDALKDPERHQGDDDGRSPEAHQRKRDTRDGGHPDVHD